MRNSVVPSSSSEMAMAAERFLILPHPEVQDYLRRKANDSERWLGGMRRLWERYQE